MKKPKRLRLDSLVLSKEGLPVPQSCGQVWLSSGKGCSHHRPRVPMLTAHRLKKDGCRILRNQSHI